MFYHQWAQEKNSYITFFLGLLPWSPTSNILHCMPKALGVLWRNREIGRRGGKREKERTARKRKVFCRFKLFTSLSGGGEEGWDRITCGSALGWGRGRDELGDEVGGWRKRARGQALRLAWTKKSMPPLGEKKRDVTTGAVSWSRGEPGYYIQEPFFV